MSGKKVEISIRMAFRVVMATKVDEKNQKGKWEINPRDTFDQVKGFLFVSILNLELLFQSGADLHKKMYVT